MGEKSVIIKKGLQKFPDLDDANPDRFRYIVAKFPILRDIKTATQKKKRLSNS